MFSYDFSFIRKLHMNIYLDSKVILEESLIIQYRVLATSVGMNERVKRRSHTGASHIK